MRKNILPNLSVFNVSDNTSLRLLLPKVATTAKLFSLLISYFEDSLQLFFGHHTAPTMATRNATFQTNTPPVPQLVTDCVAKRHAQTCQFFNMPTDIRRPRHLRCHDRGRCNTLRLHHNHMQRFITRTSLSVPPD